MVFGGPNFEKWLGHDSGGLMNEISVLNEKDPRESSFITWGHRKDI